VSTYGQQPPDFSYNPPDFDYSPPGYDYSPSGYSPPLQAPQTGQLDRSAPAYDDKDPAETVAASAFEAFERGDNIFEYTESASLEGGYTTGRYGRPFKAVQDVGLLNEICRQGWELVNGSVSKWDPGNSAYMVGFYIFRRCEANRATP
jgi:hypothetical protein